jgi:hypothetical protein
MKRLLGLALAVTCAVYTFGPGEGNAKSHNNKPPPPTEISYRLELLDAEMSGPIDINNKGEVLIREAVSRGRSTGRVSEIFGNRDYRNPKGWL